MEKEIILASASPRRRELLGMFDVSFTVIPAVGEEKSEAGLTPVHTESTTYFSQASIIFKCRKLSATLINTQDLLDKSILDRFYEDGDRHIMYVGRIEEILVDNEKL